MSGSISGPISGPQARGSQREEGAIEPKTTRVQVAERLGGLLFAIMQIAGIIRSAVYLVL
jgi:hypothetical protein